VPQPEVDPAAASVLPSPRAVLVLTGSATFLAFLDATVTNLAVPALATDFDGASISDLSWVLTAYAVVLAALLAPGGRWADAIGRRRLFLGGVSLFTLASLACALAPSLGVLVGARAVQAAGAAAMLPASLAIVLADLPPQRRLAAVGIWSAFGAFAAAVGPSLGGVLVDAADWRVLFLINLPIGVAAVVAANRVLPRPAPNRAARRPDAVGSLLIAAAVGAVAVGLVQGPEWGWSAPETVGSLVAGLLLAPAVVLRSRRHPVPAVEITLWSSRRYAATNVASMFYGAALYSLLLAGILFLTDVWRYSEREAGLAATPAALVATVVAIAAGRRSGANTVRVLVVGGAVLYGAASVGFAAAVTSEPAFLTVWLPLGCVMGAAIGMITTGTSSAAASSVTPDRFAGATGLNLAARQVGGAIGIAAMAAVLHGAVPGDVGAYQRVYLVGAAFCAASALAGWFLGRSAPPVATSPPVATLPPVAASQPVVAETCDLHVAPADTASVSS
jgi:EmrB/QacA subfamily drug resistance transporter